MVYILNIESSTSVCSASITKNGNTIALRESTIERSHAAKLSVFIDEVINEAEIDYDQLAAVAVSCGPGSFTGLRIGVSTAKGICYGSAIPLISVGTLEIMAAGVIDSNKIEENPKGNILLCPMIDARRMEVYTAIYDLSLNLIEPVSARVLSGDEFDDTAENSTIYIFGDGSDKCNEITTKKNVIQIPGIYPTAANMGKLSYSAFKEQRIEDTAYFEPFYLKDFIATTPKKNVIKPIG